MFSRTKRAMARADEALTRELVKEMEETIALPKPEPKPNVEQAKQRALSAQEVIDQTVINHQNSIGNNQKVIDQHRDRIKSLKDSVAALEQEIEDLTRLNDALTAMVDHVQGTAPPPTAKEKAA